MDYINVLMIESLCLVALQKSLFLDIHVFPPSFYVDTRHI